MKRLIASRKLKRICICCNKGFLKGEVYYKTRTIYEAAPICADEYLTCPKCKYKNDQHLKRYKKFQKYCTHPQEFIETEWSYIPGECVKEPDYDHCLLCGEILY